MNGSYTSSLDIFLACLFPISILFLGYKLFPGVSITEIRDLVVAPKPNKKHCPFSLETAQKSFLNYSNMARADLENMHRSYGTLGRAHKRVGYSLGYPRKLENVQAAITVNRNITCGISNLARREFENVTLSAVSGTEGNLMRVREVLKHFVRDWAVSELLYTLDDMY